MLMSSASSANVSLIKPITSKEKSAPEGRKAKQTEMATGSATREKLPMFIRF